MRARLGVVRARTFSSLRTRNYRLYFFSQIVSFSGSWMQTLAEAWLVLELTGSGTALGTVVAMQFIPTLLLSPYGGIIADRFDKRRLIIATQSISGLLALTMGLLVHSGRIELWMVYAIAAGFGLVTAIDNPSRQTFVVEMVGPAQVSNAVTLNSVVVNAARAIGPAIGGVIIVLVGVADCFLINAVSYVAVIGAMLAIRTAELFPGPRAVRAPGQLREGFSYAWRTPVLRTTLVMLAIIGTFTYEFTTTLPMLAEFTFDAGSTGLAALTSLMGAGAVVGGLVIASKQEPTQRRLVRVAAAFGSVVLLLSVMPQIWLAYLVMPLIGAASVGIISLSNATLQLASDPKLRGRVMALFSMAMIGSTPIGGPIAGWVGEHIDPRVSLMIGGVAALAASAYGRAHLGSTGGVPVSQFAPVAANDDARLAPDEGDAVAVALVV